MSTDPRIDQSALDAATDALALARMDSGSPRADAERVITTYLAAADNAATITEPEQLAALPAGTRLEAPVAHDFDYWLIHGDLTATCLSVRGYTGPITEIALPARVIRWGAE